MLDLHSAWTNPSNKGPEKAGRCERFPVGRRFRIRPFIVFNGAKLLYSEANFMLIEQSAYKMLSWLNADMNGGCKFFERPEGVVGRES